MKETRYLWVKNFPEDIQEIKVLEHFKRFGPVEKVKLVPKRGGEETVSAIVAFVDIRSAQHVQLPSVVNRYKDRQLQITYCDPTAMSSIGSRRSDQSPLSYASSSVYRTHSTHRSEGSRSFEGHTGERGHSGERHRGYISPASYKSSEYTEGKNSQKRKDTKSRNSASSTRVDRKSTKMEAVRIVKKKHKKHPEQMRPTSKVSKVSRQRDYVSPKKRSTKKKREESSSDEEDDDQDSSSSSDSEDESSQQSSSESSGTSESSSSSNSDSSSSRSSVDSSQGEQKLVTIIIKKLPSRPSVNNLREGIYHEFKKCGKVKSVVIRGDNNSRNALVLFRNSTEANNAISHAKTKLLFGAAIEASLYDGEVRFVFCAVSGKELQECGGIIDEFNPRASRTLFVGNLDKTVQYSDIQNIFVRFGEILAIDIKKMYNVPQYAFLQYTDIASVVKAIQKMDGELLGRNVLKLGFGKTVMSSCVWVEGVTDGFTEHYLASCFHKYGSVKRVIIDRTIGQALVFYLKYENAQKAITNLRGRNLNGSRLKLDYASHELVELFLNRMQRTGQAGPSFESIRNLLLPTPSGPGIPSSNPVPGGSRSARSSSSHPYPSRGAPYYEGMHMSRYHPPPHGYDAGPPPRGDWRSWDERSRGRPVYQGGSPRGRRYNDERGEYYHRDAEHFDRIPGRYEQDYRGPEYIRKDDFPPRAYADDYHRTMKPRDHHEPYHMTPPGRMIHRRSRSISPRLTASSSRVRGPEFDPKLDLRSREHRDHSVSRGRSPIKSPGSKDSRTSAPVYKYREHGPHMSPNVYRRDDERRVELRDPKSLPGSPRSTVASVRSKVVGGSPDSRSMGSWSTGQPLARHDVEMLAPWDIHNYERSRSETPTRDENTASIGEIIIKQPSIAHSSKSESGKTDVDKRHGDAAVKKKKAKSSQSDSKGTTPEALLQRKYSPASESHKKKQKANKDGAKEEKHKKYKQAGDELPAKKLKVLSKDEKRRKQSRTDVKSHHSEKAHPKPSALIKREYSPSSVDSGSEPQRYDRRSSKQESNQDVRIHRVLDDVSKRRQERLSKSSAGEAEPSSQHKKRKHSHTHGNDSDQNSPFRKETDSHEPKLKRSFSDTSDDVKASKRSRKGSSVHEAPLPIASQSFMSGVEEESAASIDSDAKEPSSEFRPKIVVREEVIEVEAESEEEVKESISPFAAEEDAREKKKKSRWDPKEEKKVKSGPKVAIAQPFHTSLSPFMTSKAMTESQEESDELVDSASASGTPVSESQQKLSHLEEEKKQLQALLMKLDAKQQLEGDEASQVADIYLAEVASKIKAKQAKKEKKQRTPRSDIASPAQVKVEEILQDPDLEQPDENPDEISQSLEIPEMIEEQTIVEEEVTLNDDVAYVDAPDITSTSEVPQERSISIHTQPQENIQLSSDVTQVKEFKSERQKEKYQRSLLRKQKKERERHKRKVERMRGPSQKIVSSMLDEENSDLEATCEISEDETVVNLGHENIDMAKEEVVGEEKIEQETLLTENETKVAATVASPKDVTLSVDVAKCDPVAKNDAASKLTPRAPEKLREDSTSDANAFAVPFSKDNSTPGSTPKSAKTEVSPGVHKPFPLVDENSRTGDSPFTPKSGTQMERMSQSSGPSSSSLTPLTPSPKTKLQPSQPSSRPSLTKHSSNDRRQSEDRRRKSEHVKPVQKHDSRHWKAKPSHTRYYTNLTVSRETDHSKPLDKKELDRLRIEIARVKKELGRDMPQDFLSPSADGDPQIPPMSPILKSPSIDMVTDYYGRSGASPIIGTSPSSVAASNSTSLTERMKLLGKVKKKLKSEEEVANGKASQRMRTLQGSKEFGNSRFFKSSIFDQDSQRLSHLQNVSQQDSTFKSQTSVFPSFDSGELPEDKPLFSDIVSKKDSFEQNSVESIPKNEYPLSSHPSLPAAAESADTDQAGKQTRSEAVQASPVEGCALESESVQGSTTSVAREATPDSAPIASLLSFTDLSSAPTLLGPQVVTIRAESRAEEAVSEATSDLPSAGNLETLSGSLPDTAFQTRNKNREKSDKASTSIAQETEGAKSSENNTEIFDASEEKTTLISEQTEMKVENVEILEGIEISTEEEPDISAAVAELEVENEDLKLDEVEDAANQAVENSETTVDVSQLPVPILGSTPDDFVNTQDSYIGDFGDVVATEVVSSDADFVVSQPEISGEISVQEVIAEEAPDTEDSFTADIEVKHPEPIGNECASAESSVIAETLNTVAESSASLQEEHDTDKSKKSEIDSKAVELSLDTAELPKISSSLDAASAHAERPGLKHHPDVPVKTVVGDVTDKDEPKKVVPASTSSLKETSKKVETLVVEKDASKITNKQIGDGKEKKMSAEKKAKLEKLKKERKEEKKHLKEHLVKFEKATKPSHASTAINFEKGYEKLHKKQSKDEKHKSAFSSTSKQKSSDLKSTKLTEMASSSKPESMPGEDKLKKKEAKSSRKVSESPQTSATPVSSSTVKSHLQQESQKPSKVSERAKPSTESEKKMKQFIKHDNDKKKEHKQKQSKDEKLLVHKKAKEESLTEKQKFSQSSSKKHSLTKDPKKEKTKVREASHKEQSQSAKTEKVKLKQKHPKQHFDSDLEPAKKKMKIGDNPSVTKQKQPIISSDSDVTDSEDKIQPRKGGLDSKPNLKMHPDVSESSKKSENQNKPKPEQKSSYFSSGSESSDNFDNFISQISGGSSKSTVQKKTNTKAIYSSSDSSDFSDTEVEPKTSKDKTKVKKLGRTERYDSDKSDYSTKKQPETKVKPKSKKPKASGEKKFSNLEKLPKKSEKFATKSSKSPGKDKKARPTARDSDSEISGISKLEQLQARQLLKSDSDSLSSEDEKIPPRKKLQFKKKAAKVKKSSDSSSLKEEGSASKLKKTKSSNFPAKKTEKSVRKGSSSSFESSDYASPPHHSSSFVTVETIKDEIVFPSPYMLNALAPKEWSQKSQAIYSSSSSGSDFEADPFLELTAEDKKRYFGTDSSSDSDTVFCKSAKSKVEKKRSGSAERKEKETKSKKEVKDSRSAAISHDIKETLEKSSKFSKSHEQKKDTKSKHHTSVEKPKHLHEHKQKPIRKEEKVSQSVESKTKEKEHSAIKAKNDQKLPKKAKQSDEKQRKHDEKHTKERKHDERITKERRHDDEKPRKHDEKHALDDKHKKQTEAHKVDKHKKEKSKSTMAEKPKEKSLKPEISKLSTSSKIVHKEKKFRDHSVSGTEKTDEKSKSHKEIIHAKSLKHKTKDSSHVGQQKEHLEKKDLKSVKERGQEHKVKKEAKERIHGPQDTSSTERTNPRPEKKKSPRPEKAKSESKPEVLSQGVVLPSLRIDEELKVEEDEPGRSFFYSDSSDEEKREQKMSLFAPKLTDSKSASPKNSSKPSLTLPTEPERPLISIPNEPERPSLTLPNESERSSAPKSMFSPTKEDAGDSSSSFEETIEKFSKSKYTSPSRRSSYGSLLSLPSPSKSRFDLDSESDEKSRGQRKSVESQGRGKRLTSYELYKLEQERRKEREKELKKLSQQRDEEAVRSIMAGDNATDGLSADGVEYFSSSVKEPSVGDSSLTAESTSVFDEPIESTTPSTSQQVDSLSEGEGRQVKIPTPEPRSTAEEDELAAALRSIEGFDDFNSATKQDLPGPSPSFKPQAFSQEIEKEDKKAKKDSPKASESGVEEAASAASSLLQEATPVFDKSKRETKPRSSKVDPEPAIQLPSVRYDPEPITDTSEITKDEENFKPARKSEFIPKVEESKQRVTDKQSTQALSSHTLNPTPPISQVASAPPQSEKSSIVKQEGVQHQTKQFSEKVKPIHSLADTQAQASTTTGEVTARPFVSLNPPRELSQNLVGSVSGTVKQLVADTPKEEAHPVQAVARRPSADKSFQSQPTPTPTASYPHQLPMHRSVAPIHEAALLAKPPQSKPLVSATSSFHVPSASVAHTPSPLISPHPSTVQEHPQQPPMQTSPHPAHRPAQPMSMFPQPVTTPHLAHPQTTLTRTDPTGHLRAQHMPVPVSTTPPHPPVSKPSMPQQYQPQKEREMAPQNIRSGVGAYHPQPSSVPTSHEQHQDLARGGVTTQAGSKPPHIVPQFPPHQSMFYPPRMYALSSGVPFGRPSYPNYNVPLLSQQQPQAHFLPRPHNPFVEMPKEMIVTQGIPTQNQDTEKPRQISPGRGILSHTAPRPQDFQAKMHTARPPVLELPNKPSDNRPVYSTSLEGTGRHSISMASGDSMMMVDQHFKMSGVRLPPASSYTSSMSSQASSLPASAAGAICPPMGPLQNKPPLKEQSPKHLTPSPHNPHIPMPHMVHEVYRQSPSHAPREHQLPSQVQAGPNMPHFDPGAAPTKILDQHHQKQQEHAVAKSSGQEPQDNLQDLFQRYPVIWQGKLALKNDFAAVQIHFVSGNIELGQASLPKHADSHDGTGLAELRIVQRMRTNAEQMNSLRDRMTRDQECCFLLALPCGRDRNDVIHQTKALCTGFIEYLQQKEVAGIVNVEGIYGPTQVKMKLVLHVFPPSEFTSHILQYRAPDLLSNVSDIQHLMIVVTPG